MNTLPSMGQQIRETREAQGLTLKAVADAVGVTPSLLSQVENDKAQPSVNTLRLVAQHLHLSSDALLGLGNATTQFSERAVQRRADNPAFDLEDGAHWERLAGSIDRALDIVRITYPPHTASAAAGERERFRGYEFGVLLTGELTLNLGFESVQMQAGDSVHFDTSEPHSYENSSDAPAEGIWVIVRDAAIHARILAGLTTHGRNWAAEGGVSTVLSALRHEHF